MPTSAELFDQAVRFHTSGNLQQAEPLYRQILQANPGHADALHLLGILAHQAGHAQAAVTLISQAIAVNPSAAVYHCNLGIVHKDMGNLDEAIQCYRQALRIDPRYAEAHNNLAMTLVSQGRLEEAISCYRDALRLYPDHAVLHNNLGNALKDKGSLGEAIACYRQALGIDPHNADVLNNLGVALKDLGQIDEAIACYRRALAINPNHADVYIKLGAVLQNRKQFDEAGACYRHALRINPGYPQAHYNLGNILKNQGHLDQAAQCYREALRLNPNDADAHYNLGLVLGKAQPYEAIACFRKSLQANPNNADAHNNLGNALVMVHQPAAAIVAFRQALRINPQHAHALNNLGISLKTDGKITESEEFFRRALQINPEDKVTLWNLALLRLLQGDFEAGWPHYENRLAKPGKVQRPFKQPRWDGSFLAGRTILVHAEQGFGDTIQFVRYLPLLQKRGGKVLFECQLELIGLMSDLAGIDEIIQAGSLLPPFDVQVPLLSLPGLFATTLENLPAEVPYLRAHKDLMEHWRQLLSSEPTVSSGFKVGIVWQGNPGFPGDRDRSIPLRHFQKLAGLPGVHLVSLQKEDWGNQQIKALAEPFPILDLGNRLETFNHTAAVIMNLDLVISSCTAVAHLAGALGVPVWTALQFVPDWRWFLDRPDSPWYPTMRLFRQKKSGAWEEVFERIADELIKASGAA